MEKIGYFLRLDETILPTRSRFGSVSVEDLEKMKQVKNIVRKGRVARIEEGRMIFQSGEEMELPANTLAVDCARNGTVFVRHGMKVFDGDKINVQFIQLPPPGMSVTIIGNISRLHIGRELYSVEMFS